MAHLITHMLFGPLLFILSILFRTFPPKRINYLYGYRMPASMINQETWHEANRYAANGLVALSLALSVTQIFLVWLLSPTVSVIAAASLLVAAVIAIIPLTEIHLRKTFDAHGHRRRGKRS